MEKNTFIVQLPFFAGFYESPLYNCDTLYYELHDEENMDYYREIFNNKDLTADDLDMDFAKYEEDVSKAFVDAFFFCNDCPSYIENMEFEELVSPKYYNFETDKVYAKITFRDGWREDIQAWMRLCKKSLTKRIKEDWSDRDGFMSFMPNSYEEWYDEFNKEDVDPRFISTLIGYMMEDENEDIYYDLIDATLEDIGLWNYIILANNEDETKVG